jgi:glycosyltransferase involved in cell wall biosynthesis
LRTLPQHAPGAARPNRTRARVLFLEIALQVGGAERVNAELCRRLPAHGLDARSATFYTRSAVTPELDKDNLLIARGLARSRWDLAGLGRLTTLLRRGRVDLLHVGPSPVTLVWGYLAKRLARTKAMTVAIHTSDFAADPPRRRAIRAAMLHRMDLLIALTAGHRLRLIEELRLPPQQVVVVTNGVPPWEGGTLAGGRTALGVPTEGPLIGVVAALQPYKAHDLFLRAAARIHLDLPAARFLIAGDGPERARLEHLSTKLGLGAAVTFLGHRTDVRAILPLLDLLVLSSTRTEALPLAVIEAMAAARPVVASRVGFVDELVVDGVTGRLVPIGNPQALAEAILWVLAEPERARSLGSAGRERFSAEFGADRMTQRFAEVAWSVIRRASR